jgi:hypothetical protein
MQPSEVNLNLNPGFISVLVHNFSNSPEYWQFVDEALTISRNSNDIRGSHSYVLFDSTVIH